jgi:hypothetical protein
VLGVLCCMRQKSVLWSWNVDQARLRLLRDEGVQGRNCSSLWNPPCILVELVVFSVLVDIRHFSVDMWSAVGSNVLYDAVWARMESKIAVFSFLFPWKMFPLKVLFLRKTDGSWKSESSLWQWPNALLFLSPPLAQLYGSLFF